MLWLTVIGLIPRLADSTRVEAISSWNTDCYSIGVQSADQNLTFNTMFAAKLIELGLDSFFQQQLICDDLSATRPVRVMDVQRSGLHLIGDGFDQHVELSGNDYEMQATVGDWLLLDSSTQRLFRRLERYLAIAREAPVMAVVVLTKTDLVDDPLEYVYKTRKLAPAIQVEAVNALSGRTLECLNPWLGNGQTIALLGVKTGLDDVFAEISTLAEDCRFSDCQHVYEPGCMVQDAIRSGDIDPSRLNRWRKLAREDALNSATIAERRSRDKAFGRLIKRVVSEKKAKRNS